MKVFKGLLIASSFLISSQAMAWIVNGTHTVEKLGINEFQINITLSNGRICYLESTQNNYNQFISLLHTMYASGKDGYFRCSEVSKTYSPWATSTTVYKLLEVTGNK